METVDEYGRVVTMFKRTLRRAVPGKKDVQNILSRWDEIGPLIVPILQRYSLDLTLVDSELLEPVTVIPAVLGSESFQTHEKFRVGTWEGVEIRSLGSNFRGRFVDVNGADKNELIVPAQDLRVHKLRKCSTDQSIIAELGAEELIETNLATMWELMKKQGTGEEGVLLTDSCANIFYIRDNDGTLWAISCRWTTRTGWDVEASAIPCQYFWFAGDHVFSR